MWHPLVVGVVLDLFIREWRGGDRFRIEKKRV